MTSEYSESELVSFLEYLSDKNLLNSSTASARKAAVIKILSAVDEEEKNDLRTLNLEQLFQRFTNKYGKDFTPESLVTYKSRFNLALNHFFQYKQNPATFKIGNAKRSIKESGTAKKVGAKNIAHQHSQLPPAPNDTKSYVLQIPISDGRLIEIRNLPMDLNASDAKKIAAIITAHTA
jgi:site-specific recombinase XerD